jgi:hypothetical protein
MRLLRSRFLLSAVLLACVTAPAAAQRCLGTASFARGAVRPGVGIAFADQEKSLSASVSFGEPGGWFAGGSVGTAMYEGLSENGTTFGANLGYAIPVASGGGVELCPIAQYTHQSGPKVDLGFGLGTFDLSADAYAFGLAIGGVASGSEQFELVPFASAAYSSVSASASLGGASASATQRYTLLEAGVGFVIGGRTTFRPSVAYPLGIDGATAVLSLGVSVNLGGGK